MKVLAVIMCHNAPDTTERLRRELLPVVDKLVVLDSGSTGLGKAKEADDTVYCENLYWTGCWNYAIELFRETDADILWVLGGDVELRGAPRTHLEAMKSAMPFGCWHPGVDGVSRPLLQHLATQGKPWEVWHLEGIAMAVSRQAVQEFEELPRDNKFGWGMDIWVNWRCWKAGMRNILDGRVKIFHPDLRGYNSASAQTEMFTWFEKEIGPKYRDELRYWSDSFEQNKICEMRERFGASVVVTSYNQLPSLKLVMESFKLQEVKPVELIVADDGSTDGTLEWLDSLHADDYPFLVSYVTSEHNGYNLAGAYNAGAKMARGSRIIFTNADIIHNRISVKGHMNLAGDEIGMGYIGMIPLPKSKMVTKEHVGCHAMLHNMIERSFYLCNARLQGGNFSIPVAMYMELGGFSDEYDGKYGGEVAGLMERAHKLGYQATMASIGGSTTLVSSCGWHLAHPTKAYKKSQLGNKHFQKEIGIQA